MIARRSLSAGVGAVLALALVAPSAGAQASAKSAFLERCGGCHGLDGKSAAVLVPDPRDQVGYFLARQRDGPMSRGFRTWPFPASPTRRWPGSSTTPSLPWGASAPAGAKAYSAAEVGRLRRQPLTATDLVAQRAAVAEAVIAACPAAVGLRIYKSQPAVPASAKETTR